MGATTLTGNYVIGNRFEGIVLDQGDAAVSFNVVNGGNRGVLAVALKPPRSSSTRSMARPAASR